MHSRKPIVSPRNGARRIVRVVFRSSGYVAYIARGHKHVVVFSVFLRPLLDFLNYVTGTIERVCHLLSSLNQGFSSRSQTWLSTCPRAARSKRRETECPHRTRSPKLFLCRHSPNELDGAPEMPQLCPHREVSALQRLQLYTLVQVAIFWLWNIAQV